MGRMSFDEDASVDCGDGGVGSTRIFTLRPTIFYAIFMQLPDTLRTILTP
jgi:hypothetical protein